MCEKYTATYMMGSPIGDIALVACSKGLHAANQIIKTDDEFLPDLRRRVELKSQDIEAPFKKTIERAVEWFQTYFANPHSVKEYGLPLICMDCMKGEFMKNVCMTLASNVHAGQTITYGELAAQCGSKGAAQAVGQAMASNAFQIIVPCHRVLPKSGALGQYARGRKNKVKDWLLHFESCKDLGYGEKEFSPEQLIIHFVS